MERFSHVSADFETMRNVFADNLSRHYEPDGVSCAHHCGDKVVNY